MNPKQKAQLFYQFSALLKTGIGVQQSLLLVGKESDRIGIFQRHNLQNCLKKASLRIGDGESLGSALSKSCPFFDNWTISLLGIAEQSGFLQESCQLLAEEAEAEQKKQRIYRSISLNAIAILWSILILIAAILIPNPYGVFKLEFWLRSLMIGIILLIAGLGLLRYLQYNSEPLRYIPGLNKLVEANSLLYLGKLRSPLACGIPILTAIELLRKHIPNRTMATKLGKIARKMRLGQSITESFQSEIPTIALQMIRTGEETGNLDTAMQSISQYYEQQLNYQLNFLKTSLRPINLLVFGGLVGLIGIRCVTFLMNSLPG
ncbi:MAG: type II secretion system F family protein [Halothece sp.]